MTEQQRRRTRTKRAATPPPPDLGILERTREALGTVSRIGLSDEALSQLKAGLGGELADQAKLVTANLGKIAALGIDPTHRTFPEIARDAARLRDIALSTPTTVEPSVYFPSPETRAMKDIARETRRSNEALAGLFDQAGLQAEIAGRQEAALGVVVNELRASRKSNDRNGTIVAILTLVLVVLTFVLIVKPGA